MCTPILPWISRDNNFWNFICLTIKSQYNMPTGMKREESVGLSTKYIWNGQGFFHVTMNGWISLPTQKRDRNGQRQTQDYSFVMQHNYGVNIFTYGIYTYTPRNKWSYSRWLALWRHQMETFSALLAILCGELCGPRWIPRTKASDAELVYFIKFVSGNC